MKKTKIPLLLLTLLGLMMACSLPFPAGPSGEADHGSFTLSGSETDFEYDRIKIAIRRNEPGEDIQLRFKTLPDPSPSSSEEEDAYASDIYILENFPQDFQGTVEFRFSLPQEVVDENTNHPDEYTLYALVGSTPYPDQLSMMDAAVPLDVDIDQESGEAILVLEGGGGEPSFYRSSGLSQDGTYVQDGVTVQIRSSWGQIVYAETDHFILKTYDYRDNSTSTVLLAELEKVFHTIQDMGIGMGKFASDDKIKVYLKPMKGKDGAMGASLFTDPYITINSLSLELNDDGSLSELSNNVRATIAHETFHIAQYLDHGSYDEEFLWLDEATASWFEIYYLETHYGVSGHLSDISGANSDFFLFSQYNAPEEERGEVGYGAAIYYDYLFEQYGLELIRGLFVEGTSAEEVMYSVLNEFNSVMTYHWTLFLEKLAQRPAELTPEAGKIEAVLSQNVVLIAEEEAEEENEENTKLTANTNADLNLATTEGRINPDGQTIKPLEFSFSVPLKELQAYPMLIRSNRKSPPQNPGQLVIEVDAPDFAGVMVFATITDSIGIGTQMLAGEQDYLTAGDFAGPSTLTINGFGSEEDPTYRQVLLLPFNADTKASGEDAELITITVTFAPSAPPYQMVSDSMSVTRHIPEDVCNKMPPGADSCVDDPPCSKNGGSSSGGVITDDMTACLEIPDWCYDCDPNYPATQLNYGYDGEIKMTLEMNGAGEIVSVRDSYGPWMYYASGDVPNEPEIEHNLSTGAFKITFPGLFLDHLDRVNPKGYLIYEGVIEGDQAKGTWELGYEGAGTFFSAEWTASAER